MEIKDVKSNLNQHVKMNDKDGDYLFTGYILRRGKKDFIHQAELQDVGCGHCIVVAALKDVEAKEKP